MSVAVFFNKAVQRDVSQILEHYETESGSKLANAFYEDLNRRIEDAEAHPEQFRSVEPSLRRANLRRFPYHFLFREIGDDIRVLVVRHHRRHPSFGIRRR